MFSFCYNIYGDDFMIIGMSCTRNWYQHLLTNIFAILSNNKVERFYLFIEDDTIDGLDLLENCFNTKFICKNVHNIFANYVHSDSPNLNTPYTIFSLSRLFFSKETDESRILYLDVDALVIDNIQDLWNLDMENYYVAGAIDSGMMKDGLIYMKFIESNVPYINSGVLLMNLDLIRKDHIDDKWLSMINSERLMYPDQDVINALCKDHIYIISEEYNSSRNTELLEDISQVKILHYTRKKIDWVRNHPFSEVWYDYEAKYEAFKKEH